MCRAEENCWLSDAHFECLFLPGHRGPCTTSQALHTRVGEWKSSKFWNMLCDVWMVPCLTPVETVVCLFHARLRENSKDKRQETEAYRCCFHKVFVFVAVKTTCPSVSFWVLFEYWKKKKKDQNVFGLYSCGSLNILSFLFWKKEEEEEERSEKR